jgi:L-ribulose-5-phosphate 3-epimerase
MNNPLSFNGANYVARFVGYHMTGGWGQGDRATNEHFRPQGTYRERLAEILRDVRSLGFRHIDLWTAQLGPSWATPEHLRIAREELASHDLEVASLGGWFGSTAEEFEATCRIASGVGCRILAGSTSLLDEDRAFVVGTLRAHDLVLGLENHPEPTPQALRDRIGAGEGVVLATVDTGWFGTQGYDAARALEELADVLAYVHLKDVRAAGAHDTCRYGEGVVPLEACVRTLERVGYAGAISVEHEPEAFDPADDIRASRAMLLAWMGREASG